MTPRYRSFNQVLREKYNTKVYRVSLDAGFDCPNRDGLLAVGGCTYCDEGSRAPGINPTLSIEDQMKTGMERMKNRYGAQKFIAYFQAFTNTYAHVDTLKKRYEEALQFNDIIGLSVSTRPDTLSDGALSLLASYTDRYDVWCELGLQTIHDKTNEKLNRWHTFQQFEKALHRARQKKNLQICVHVILGLPQETEQEMRKTMEVVSKLPIDGIKIHLLHVIKNTALEKDYAEKKFEVLSQEKYISLVCDFLEMLPPHVIIHRLTGEAERSKMIAPLWVLHKAHVLHAIDQELQKRGTYQGFNATLSM